MSPQPEHPFVFLDTETTGLEATAQIVEIALVDHHGEVLLNTLVNPLCDIPSGATAIHGITDEMVVDAPILRELIPALRALVRSKTLVIYNAQYDLKYLPMVSPAAFDVHCAMLMAMTAMGRARWPRLSAAADWAGHTWSGKAHRALADAQAARTVYLKALEVNHAY